MGHRASYVVIEHHTPAIYRSHWGALTTPQVVLAGPDATVAHIRHLDRHDDLLDTVWAEGGILVDLDSRTLIFYGGDDLRYAPYLRRLFLQVLRQIWRGWSVTYARFGVVDFAHHLGADVGSVLAGDPAGDARAITLDELRSPTDAAFDTCLVTVTWPDGGVADYRFAYYARTIAALGPDLLSFLQRRAPAAFPHEGEQTEYGTSVDNGVYIDVPTRIIWLWDAAELDPRWLEAIARAWPGWRVEGHIDGVVHQAVLSGRDPTPYMVADAEAARELVAALSSGWSFDPGALLKVALSNPPAGATRAEIAPGSLRVDAPPLPPEARRSLLEQILQDVRR